MKAARLVLAIVSACTSSQPKDGSDESHWEAYQILAGSQRVLGNTEVIRAISAVADVSGPRGSFQTWVSSARDGRARLDLGGQFLAGVGTCHGWLMDEAAKRVTPLDKVSRSVVRGHELHMLVLAPETRWHRPHARGSQRWAGEPALTVEFKDDLGEAALMYFRPSDTLPIGLRLMNHTGHGAAQVDVTFGDWEKLKGVQLFRSAVFEHGGERYVYHYANLQINGVSDTVFEPPTQLAHGSKLHR
jgi:hypothetical protein